MAQLTNDGGTIRAFDASWLESSNPEHVEASDRLASFVTEFGKAEAHEWQVRGGIADLADGGRFAREEAPPA